LKLGLRLINPFEFEDPIFHTGEEQDGVIEAAACDLIQALVEDQWLRMLWDLPGQLWRLTPMLPGSGHTKSRTHGVHWLSSRGLIFMRVNGYRVWGKPTLEVSTPSRGTQTFTIANPFAGQVQKTEYLVTTQALHQLFTESKSRVATARATALRMFQRGAVWPNTYYDLARTGYFVYGSSVRDINTYLLPTSLSSPTCS
jgi:hypothetical protein